MKTLLKSLVVTTALSLICASGAIAQEASPVEVRKISASLIPTPNYTFSRSPDQRTDNEEWLAVEIEFSNEAELLDEITMRVHIALKQLMGREGNRYLTGEVTYVNILKGRDKLGIVYVAPNTLKIYNGGKAISSGDVEEVGVELLYKGRVVGQTNMNDNGRGPWWQQMQPLTGHVLNKNQAVPFAPLYWTRYEQIQAPQN